MITRLGAPKAVLRFAEEIQPARLDEEVKRAFAALAEEYVEVSARLFANDPDLGVDPVEDD